ncbi:sensor histidine kinase [Microbacterium sp. RU33B]|uniref:sensor histidine kinase n=1 Tax=Microbacterium sp. RU33B TaxID=1907390 RepID=UPI00095B6002|nr:sensor histidine kinase [Microbacterium sp. RU33B]SIT86390.1 Signal transduction histidine kinase [Microbacterium sp. RU33B]
MLDTAPTDRVRLPVTRSGLRADAALAAALLVGAVLSSALGSVAGLYGDDTLSLEWALLYAVAVAAPLALRRKYPEIVALTVALAFFVGGSLRVTDVYVGNIALFIAVYTVGAWVDDRRRATIVRVVIIVGMFVWLLVTMFQSATAPTDEGLSRVGLFSPFVAFMLMQLLVNIAFFGGAYFMGDRAYLSARERASLEERTRELESEREVTAAQAVALDRVRIARELHDVVAHHVSAMGVQAGAARAVMDRDPDAARTALIGVEASARSALAELRQLLETLRAPGGEAVDGSTLRLDDLAALVAHARENGLPTTFAVVGEPVPLPDVVQVNLYRVAQEALTNARRHGGPDASADVRLRYSADSVELEIASAGRLSSPGTRTGLGIVGMRERAAASGGTIEIGPRPRGGFLVRLRVPVRSEVLA